MSLREKIVNKMDKENKVGYTAEGFENLSEVEQKAVAVEKFIGQVHNGGVYQFYCNGYSYMVETLLEVANEIDLAELANMIYRAEELLEFYTEFDDELYDHLDMLDVHFYAGLDSKLRKNFDQYLKSIVNQ